MPVKPTRAFPEDSPFIEDKHGKRMPKYVFGTPLMMDIGFLADSHFGQKVKSYDWDITKAAIKKFNDFWGTKLSYKIDFKSFELEYTENDELEYTDPKEFEKFWNRHTVGTP